MFQWNGHCSNVNPELDRKVFKLFTATFDDGSELQFDGYIKNLVDTNTIVGDRIRVYSKNGDFEKNNSIPREYYNLDRHLPPMKKPYKRYMNKIHTGADGNYTVVENPSGKRGCCGQYMWQKVE